MSRTQRKRPALLACPPLSEALGRKNGFGLLRLVLALSVIFAHAMPLGMGKHDLGYDQAQGQTNVGAMAVAGFFVLSGLLITRSGMRLSTGRFMWNRAIRILPGLWVCLLVTALVIAPLVAYHQGRLDGFWSHPQGPWSYLKANYGIGVGQWGVSGLLDHNPHPTAFNGSVWSLSYEVFCYLAVAALAALGILHRARWAVALLVAGMYAYLVSMAVDFDRLRLPLYAPTDLQGWRFPFLDWLSMEMLLPVGFMFGLGAVAELYKKRLPINPVAGVLAFGVVLATAHYGGFTVIGLPAFAYVLLVLAARMPGPLTKVGTKVDLSYGVYIYAFPIQQCLTLWEVNRHGYAVYTALSVALALLAALCSWFLVEKPALKLKDLGLRRPPKAGPGTAGTAAPAAAPAGATAPAPLGGVGVTATTAGGVHAAR
ncbi:acyltransferase family protein [Kitasatospora sp. NPDC058201]|uniref:acyltransferase family protein n=1 Tax=unclassified Kitasatospora TaxID=2633591 RepID=UPI0036473EA7